MEVITARDRDIYTYDTVWSKRFYSNKNAYLIVSGTIYSMFDILTYLKKRFNIAGAIVSKKVFVDELPLSCAECSFCVNDDSWFTCACLPPEQDTAKGKVKNYIENPYNMYYRRSDCKLEKYTN